jgi:hypothetical protein
MALSSARHQAVNPNDLFDANPPSLATEDEEFAPTKVGPMSRAHVEAMMRDADEGPRSGVEAADQHGSGLRPMPLPKLGMDDEPVEATRLVPEGWSRAASGEVETTATKPQDDDGQVNELSSEPQGVDSEATVSPDLSVNPLSLAPQLVDWDTTPEAERLARSYSQFLPPSRETKDRQLAKEIVCGAAAFIVVLVPALYLLFR